MELDTSKIGSGLSPRKGSHGASTEHMASERRGGRGIRSERAWMPIMARYGNVALASALSACLALTSVAWACAPDVVEQLREAIASTSAPPEDGEPIDGNDMPLAEFEGPVEDEPYTEQSTERKLDSLIQVTFEKREAPAEPAPGIVDREPAAPEPATSPSPDPVPESASSWIEPAPAIIEAPPAAIAPSWSQSQFANMTQADFANKTISQKIELIGAMARQDMHESGILASITCAQAILESGWMDSGLAKRNNLFGIKASKKVNAWEGTTWTGTYVEFKTSEEYVQGEYTVITAKFRTYPSVWASIKDHSAYLANCYNGGHKRYEGIVGCRDPRAGFQIIKDGGYATSSTYVDSLMRVVEKYDLTRFDS